MIQFKKLFLNSTLALLILFGSIQVTSAALSERCSTPPTSTTQRVQFTQTECPDGLGYPSINSFKNVERFRGLPRRDESDFSLVKLGNTSGGEANYSNQVTLSDSNPTAKFFNYIHNGGNPICNTDDQSTLDSENCSESTIAEDVKIKIISGLELYNGEVISEANSTGRYNIIFEITSANTYPRRIRDNIEIIAPENRRIKLNLDSANFINNVCRNPQPLVGCSDYIQNRFNPVDLVTDGITLSSSFNGSGAAAGDFYASLGYRILQTGVIELMPEEPLECRLVQIIDPEDVEVDWEARTAQFNVIVDADLTREEILNRLNADVFGNPDSTFFTLPSGTLSYSDLDDRFSAPWGSPTYRFTVSDIDPGDRFEISLPGFEDAPSCSDTFTFPPRPNPGVPACTLMELENLSTDWDSRTAEFRLQVVADLTPDEIETRLNSNPNGPDDPFTSEFGAMNFSQVTKTGRFLISPIRYNFTVSNIDNGDKFSVRLPGFYDVPACSVEYTFSRNLENGCDSFVFDDASFRENSRLVGATIDYTATPASFNTNTNITCVSNTDTGRYRVNPNGQAGSTTGSINLGAFGPGKSITCTAETGNTACTDTFTFPNPETPACESFTITPVKFTPGETETFRINNITPSEFSANVIWKVIDEDGTVVISSVSQPITNTFTSGSLTETQKVTVELVDQALNPTGNCRGEALPEIPQDTTCEDLSITPRQFTPGQTGSFRVENVRPVGFDSPLTWEVKNPLGELIQTGSSAINGTFIPNSPLQANHTVSVKVTNTELDPDGNCVDVISSQEQTVVCENLQIAQTTLGEGVNNLSLNGILPAGFNSPVTWTTTQNGTTSSVVQNIDQTYSTPSLTNGATVSVQVANSAFDPNGVCRDSRTLTTTPTPPEEIVCEDLILTDQDNDELNNGDNLPGDRVTTLQFRTEPSQYESQVQIRGRNLTVLRDGDEYNVFNVNRNSELEFFVPGSPACRIELDGEDDDFDIDLIKEISATNSFPRTPGRNYIFTDLGRSIFYRLTLDTNNTDFPRGTTFTVFDDIEDGIPGLRNGDRGGEYGELSLDRPSSFNRDYDLNSDVERIVYEGSIDWRDRRADCQDFTGDCSVRYRNQAEVEIEVPGEPIPGIDNPEPEVIVIESNPTYAIVVCPFIITRGFGDIYLEKQFSTGVNIQACGRVNSQSPVFTPAPRQEGQIVQTGSADSVNLPSHGICKALQTESTRSQAIQQLRAAGLDDYYTPEQLNNFSSSVCQVAIVNAERWEKEKISAKLRSNFARIAPASKAAGATTLSAISDSTISSRTKITAYKGLTLGSNSGTVSISGNSARTFVVYGDLIINSNVTYARNSSGTVAFIVIGGDIKIKEGVEQINGVYATIDNDAVITWNNENKESSTPIVIRGSAYGNIDPLFAGVNSAGNLATDRGGVTVIFDGRITRKIPPGLQDVIKFNQFQTATQSNFFSQSE